LRAGTGGFAAAQFFGSGRPQQLWTTGRFAWDIFGDGNTSLRGGFGVGYEGTRYNPLSNSGWNPPYYSFNAVPGGVGIPGGNIVYGPSTCASGTCIQDPLTAPNFTKQPGGNPNQGPAGQAQTFGNLGGWDPSNPNFANLTGIIFPSGVRDPYVYNFYLDIQREILPKTVVDIKYVGTAGHKLFRAEDINREPGSLLPAGITVVDNFGRTLTGLGGKLNGNFGKLRNWENSVNSNYNSFQGSVKRQMSRGVLFSVDYTYSHSIDDGSTWHSGATTANGAAGGEGYTTDQTQPGLDRGNSIYDIRHRLVANYVWQLPGQNLKGAAGAMLGGWSLNGIWSFQSGAHFQPFTSSAPKLTGDCSQSGVDNGLCINKGGDFNLDHGRNDRPSSSVPGFDSFSRNVWANGWCTPGPDGNYTGSVWGGCAANDGIANQANLPILTRPTTLGGTGNLGRNTFVGPGNWAADMTLSKTFKITERFNMKFDAAAFNVFNRANFILATAGGGAANKPTGGTFGQAAGTLRAREMQFGLKLSF
jgi:hypothetical protein